MEKIFNYLKGDKTIWLIVMALSVLSIPEVYSTSAMLAYKYQNGNTVFYVLRHLGYMLLGFIAMYGMSLFSFKKIYKLATPMLVIAILILLFTLLTGTSTNDAKRWFTIPLIGLSFQSSDLAKVALMFFLAKELSRPQDSMAETRIVFFRCIAAIGIVCLLILPSNLSTTLLLGFACVCVLIVGQMPIKWVGVLIGGLVLSLFLFVGGVKVLGIHSRVDTWSKRVETFFSDTHDKQAEYQQSQAAYAIASGGVLGVGVGNSQQRNVVPHPYSDFIFCIIAEEMGLWGPIIVILLYLVLFYRCIIIVKATDRTFGAFLVVGLALNLMMQAVTNMMVATGVMPVTGQPLPFVSMGGTSQMFNSISIGIILNVSRYARESVSEIEEDQETEEIIDYPFMAG